MPLVERIVTFLQRRPLPSPTHQQKGELAALIVILKRMWWTEKNGEICSANPLLGITISAAESDAHTYSGVCLFYILYSFYALLLHHL